MAGPTAERIRAPLPPGDPPGSRIASAAGPRRFGPRLTRRGARVLAAVVVVLSATVVWVVYGSAALAVRTVMVSGTHLVPPDTVRRATGVSSGDSLARVDTEAVRRRVGKLARIATVEVTRSWPHTLRVRVTERQRVALLRAGVTSRDSSDGAVEPGYAEIDASGTRLGTVTVRPRGVPVLELDLDQAAQAAVDTFGEAVLLSAAVRVAGDLPAGVRSKTRAVVVHSYDDIRLRLADDHTVVWGSPERGTRKAVVLVALLKHAGGVYDVSAPDAPAVRR